MQSKQKASFAEWLCQPNPAKEAFRTLRARALTARFAMADEHFEVPM